MESNFIIKKSNLDELFEFISNYLKEEKIYIDDYNEYFILSSTFYKIELDHKLIGCFAIHNNESITLFAISEPYNKYAFTLFKEAKTYENVNSALVVGFDRLFFSLCMDQYKSIEKTGYCCFAPTTKREIPQKVEIVRSTEDDYEKLTEIHKPENYFGDLKEYITRGEIYNVVFNNTLVGFVMYTIGAFNTSVVSYSFFINESFRNKGLAKSAYLTLSNRGISEKKIGVSGCAYENVASLNVQLSAGATTKDRSYKFMF